MAPKTNNHIKHKFRNHIVSNDTEILILGTFHPDIANSADFFYGRPRNYFWKILPICLGASDLKSVKLEEKKEFMEKYKVDFADIIKSLKDIPKDQLDNYQDTFIDKQVDEWNEILKLTDSLKNLKAVYFTRKTLGSIPNIQNKIMEIRNHCVENCIRFSLLDSPSRNGTDKKISIWRDVIVDKKICL